MSMEGLKESIPAGGSDSSTNIKKEHANIKCKQCGTLFDSSEILQDHIKTDHPQCVSCTCGKTFESYQAYKPHVKTCPKNGPGKYNCPLCGQQFTRKDSLTKHNKRKHDKDQILADSEMAAEVHSAKKLKLSPKEVASKSASTSTGKPTRTRDMHRVIGKKESISVVRLKDTSVVKKCNSAGRKRGNTGNETDPHHVIEEACKELDKRGVNVMVLTSEGDNIQWFGAGLGKTFGTEMPNLIDKFFKYCHEKTDRKIDTADYEAKKPGPRSKQLQRKVAQKRTFNRTVGLNVDIRDDIKDETSEPDVSLNRTTHSKLKRKENNSPKKTSRKSPLKTSDIDGSKQLLDETYKDSFKDDTTTTESAVVKTDEVKEIYKIEITNDNDASYNDTVDKTGNGVGAGSGVEDDDDYDDDTDDYDNDYVEDNDEENDENKRVSEMAERAVQDVTENKLNAPKKKKKKREDRVCEMEKLRLAKKRELYKQVMDELQKIEHGDLSQVAEIVRRRYHHSRVAVYSVHDFNVGKYECQKCKYKFMWKRHLQTHQIKHPQCSPDDNYNVKNKDILKEEVTFLLEETGIEISATFQSLLEAQNGRNLCIICNMSTSSAHTLVTHYVTHNKKEIFKCNICSQAFTGEVHLSSHLKDHFMLPYECATCTWRFESQTHLDRHSQNGCGNISLLSGNISKDKHLDKNYKCSVCKAEITGLTPFQTHANTAHPGENVGYECEHCGKIMDKFHIYEEHLRQHVGIYPCPFCEKMLPSKNALGDHVRHHRSKMREFVCYVCGESFNMKRKFDVHLRIHTGENPYKCQEEGCDKSFRSVDGLQQHRWCHNKDPLMCDICGRKFKSPNRLNYHRRNHTVEWRWPCIYCTEKFKSLFTFKRHLAQKHPEMKDDIHEKTNIKLYQCDICSKMYHDHDDLKNHLNNHKGLKPFSCKYCGKAFSDKSNKKYHEENHEGVRKLKCSICSRKFKQQEFLTKHMERIHQSTEASAPTGQEIAVDFKFINTTEPLQNSTVQPQNVIIAPQNGIVPSQNGVILPQNTITIAPLANMEHPQVAVGTVPASISESELHASTLIIAESVNVLGGMNQGILNVGSYQSYQGQ